MLLEKERKDKVVRFKISESARQELFRAADLAGAEDFSEWARKTLTREAKKVLEESYLGRYNYYYSVNNRDGSWFATVYHYSDDAKQIVDYTTREYGTTEESHRMALSDAIEWVEKSNLKAM